MIRYENYIIDKIQKEYNRKLNGTLILTGITMVGSFILLIFLFITYFLQK